MANDNNLFGKNLFGVTASEDDLFSSSLKPELDSGLESQKKEFESLFKTSAASNKLIDRKAENAKLMQEASSNAQSVISDRKRKIDAINKQTRQAEENLFKQQQQAAEQQAKATQKLYEDQIAYQEKLRQEQEKKRKQLISAIIDNPDLIPRPDLESWFNSPEYQSMPTDQRRDVSARYLEQAKNQLEGTIAGLMGFEDGKLPDTSNWTLDQIAENQDLLEDIQEVKQIHQDLQDEMEIEFLNRLESDVNEIESSGSLFKDLKPAIKTAWEQLDLSGVSQKAEKTTNVLRGIQSGNPVDADDIKKYAPQVSSLVDPLTDEFGNVDPNRLTTTQKDLITKALQENNAKTLIEAENESRDVKEAEQGFSEQIKNHQANVAYNKLTDPDYDPDAGILDSAQYAFKNTFLKDPYSTLLPSVPSIGLSIGSSALSGAAYGASGGPGGVVVGALAGGAAGGAYLTASDIVSSTIDTIDAVPTEQLAQRVPNWEEYLEIAGGDPEQAKKILKYATAGEQREWGYLIGGLSGLVDPGTILGAALTKPVGRLFGGSLAKVAGNGVARQVGSRTTEGVMSRIAKTSAKGAGAVLGGAGSEAFEEGFTQFASNYGAYKVGAIDDPMQGVGEAAGVAAGIGGLFGGGAYGIGKTGSAMASAIANRDGVIRVTAEEAADINGNLNKILGTINSDELVSRGKVPMTTLKRSLSEAFSKADEPTKNEVEGNIPAERRAENARARKQIIYDGLMSIKPLTSRMTEQNTVQLQELARKNGLNVNPFQRAGWTEDMVAYDQESAGPNTDRLTIAALDLRGNRAISNDADPLVARAADTLLRSVNNSAITRPNMTTNDRVILFSDIIAGISEDFGLNNAQTRELQIFAATRLNINTLREGDNNGQVVSGYIPKNTSGYQPIGFQNSATNASNNTQGPGNNPPGQGGSAGTGTTPPSGTGGGSGGNTQRPAQTVQTGASQSPTGATQTPNGSAQSAGTNSGAQTGGPTGLSGSQSTGQTGSRGSLRVASPSSDTDSQRQGTASQGDTLDNLTTEQRILLDSYKGSFRSGSNAINDPNRNGGLTSAVLDELVDDLISKYGIDYTLEFLQMASDAAWSYTDPIEFSDALDAITKDLDTKYGEVYEQQRQTNTGTQGRSSEGRDGSSETDTTETRIPRTELRADQSQETGSQEQSPVTETAVVSQGEVRDSSQGNRVEQRPEGTIEPEWDLDVSSPNKIVHTNVTAREYAQNLINEMPYLTDRELEVRAAVASTEPTNPTDANVIRKEIERQVYGKEIAARRDAEFRNNRRTDSSESLESLVNSWVDFAGQVGFLYSQNGEYRLTLGNGTDIFVADVADNPTQGDLDIVPVNTSKPLSDMNSGLRNWMSLNDDQKPATARTFLNEFVRNAQRVSDERIAQHEEDAAALEQMIQEEAQQAERDRNTEYARSVREALDEIYKELYRLGFDEAGATEYIGAMIEHLESGRPLNNPEMLGAKAINGKVPGNVARRNSRADEVEQMSSLELANAIYDYVALQSDAYSGERAGAEQSLAMAANLLVDMGYTPDEALAEVQQMSQDMALYLGNSPRSEETRVTARDDSYEVGNYGLPPLSEDVADATLGVVENELLLEMGPEEVTIEDAVQSPGGTSRALKDSREEANAILSALMPASVFKSVRLIDFVKDNDSSNRLNFWNYGVLRNDRRLPNAVKEELNAEYGVPSIEEALSVEISRRMAGEPANTKLSEIMDNLGIAPVDENETYIETLTELTAMRLGYLGEGIYSRLENAVDNKIEEVKGRIVPKLDPSPNKNTIKVDDSWEDSDGSQAFRSIVLDSFFALPETVKNTLDSARNPKITRNIRILKDIESGNSFLADFVATGIKEGNIDFLDSADGWNQFSGSVKSALTRLWNDITDNGNDLTLSDRVDDEVIKMKEDLLSTYEKEEFISNLEINREIARSRGDVGSRSRGSKKAKELRTDESSGNNQRDTSDTNLDDDLVDGELRLVDAIYHGHVAKGLSRHFARNINRISGWDLDLIRLSDVYPEATDKVLKVRDEVLDTLRGKIDENFSISDANDLVRRLSNALGEYLDNPIPESQINPISRLVKSISKLSGMVAQADEDLDTSYADSLQNDLDSVQTIKDPDYMDLSIQRSRERQLGDTDEQVNPEQDARQTNEQSEPSGEQVGKRSSLRRNEGVQSRTVSTQSEQTDTTANQGQQQTTQSEKSVDQVDGVEQAAQNFEELAQDSTPEVKETGKRKKLTAKSEEPQAESDIDMTTSLESNGVTAEEIIEGEPTEQQPDLFETDETQKQFTRKAVKKAIDDLPESDREHIKRFANSDRARHDKTRKELGLKKGVDAEEAIVEAAAADSELGFLEDGYWAKTTKAFKAAVRKAIKNLKQGLKSIAFVSMLGLAALNPDLSLTNQAMASDTPTNVSVETVIPSVSQDANVVRNYVQANNDAQGRPYLVADKQAGAIYLFDADHNLLTQTPALFGANVSDSRDAGSTPAGKFSLTYTKYDQSVGYGGNIQIFDSTPTRGTEQVFAVHRVINPAGQNRPGRLQSKTASDNRISNGCINVPASFYNDHLDTNFDGFMYIIPETTNYSGNTFGVNPGGDPDPKYTNPVEVQATAEQESPVTSQQVEQAATEITIEGNAPQTGGMASATPLTVSDRTQNSFAPAVQVDPTTVNGVTYSSIVEPDDVIAPDDATANEYFNTDPISSNVTDDDGLSIFDVAMMIFGSIAGAGAARLAENKLSGRRKRLTAKRTPAEQTFTPAQGGTPNVPYITMQGTGGQTPTQAVGSLVAAGSAMSTVNNNQSPNTPPVITNAQALEDIQRAAQRRGWFNYVNAISDTNQQAPLLVVNELLWGIRNALTDGSLNVSTTAGGEQDDWRFVSKPTKAFFKNMGGATIELDKLAKQMGSPTTGVEADSSVISSTLASMKGQQLGIQGTMYRNSLQRVENEIKRVAARRGMDREEVEQDFGDYANLFHYSEEGIDHHIGKLRSVRDTHRNIYLSLQEELDRMVAAKQTKTSEYADARNAYRKAERKYEDAQKEFFRVLYAVEGPQVANRELSSFATTIRDRQANANPQKDSFLEKLLSADVARMSELEALYSKWDAMDPDARPMPDNLPGGLTRAQTEQHMNDLEEKYNQAELRRVAQTIYDGARFNVDYAYAHGVFTAADMRAFGQVNNGEAFQFYVPMWHSDPDTGALGDTQTFTDRDEFNANRPDGFVERDPFDDVYDDTEKAFIERVGLAKDITRYAREGSRTRPDNAVANLRKQMNNLASRSGERAFTFQIERMFENSYAYEDANGDRVAIQNAEDAQAWFDTLTDDEKAQLDTPQGLQPEGRRGLVRYRPGVSLPASLDGHVPIKAKGLNSKGEYIDYRYYFVDDVVSDEVKGAIGTYARPKGIGESVLRKTTGIMASLMTHARPVWNVLNALQSFIEYGGNMMYRRALGPDGRPVSNRKLALGFVSNASRVSASYADIAKAIYSGETDTHYGRLYQELKANGTVHVYQDLVNMKAERAFNRDDPSVTKTERAKARVAQAMDSNGLTQGIKSVATTAGGLYNQALVETMQVIPVLATFETLIDAGVNRQEANRITRDMYDPLRNSQYMGRLTSLYAFANSAKAGGYNLARNLTQYGGKGFAITLAAITTFAMLHAVAGAFGEDDDDGVPKRASEPLYTFTRGFGVTVDDNGGKFYIPIGHGPNKIFSTIAGIIYKASLGKMDAKEAGLGLATAVIDNASPLQVANLELMFTNFGAWAGLSAVPTALQPLGEVAVGYDSFTGRNLNPFPTPEGQNDADRDGFYTQQWAKDWAQFLRYKVPMGPDVKPETIEHIVESNALGPLAIIKTMSNDVDDKTMGVISTNADSTPWWWTAMGGAFYDPNAEQPYRRASALKAKAKAIQKQYPGIKSTKEDVLEEQLDAAGVEGNDRKFIKNTIEYEKASRKLKKSFKEAVQEAQGIPENSSKYARAVARIERLGEKLKELDIQYYEENNDNY